MGGGVSLGREVSLGGKSLGGKRVWGESESGRKQVVISAGGGPCLQFVEKNPAPVKHNKAKYNKLGLPVTLTLPCFPRNKT